MNSIFEKSQQGLIPGENLFINGCLSVCQRPVPSGNKNTVGRYVADRFLLTGDVGVDETTSIIASVGHTHRDLPCTRFLSYNYVSGNGRFVLTQRVAFPKRLSGRQVTVSFYAHAVTMKDHYSSGYAQLYNPTDGYGEVIQFPTPTRISDFDNHSWARYSITLDIPELKSHLDIVAGSFISFNFLFVTNVGSTWGGISGLKLEYGSFATPFIMEDFGVNLNRCLPYYENITFPSSSFYYPPSLAGRSYPYTIPIPFSAPKIRTPTMTLVNAESNFSSTVFHQVSNVGCSYGPPQHATCSDSSGDGYIYGNYVVANAELG